MRTAWGRHVDRFRILVNMTVSLPLEGGPDAAPPAVTGNGDGRGVSSPAPSPEGRSVNRWRGEDSRDSLLALVFLGAVIEIFLVVLTRRFWLSNWFPGPGVSLGFPQMMSGFWSSDFRWLALILIAPFEGFVPAIWYARRLRSRFAAGIVFGFAALFAVTLLGLYPITASDLFHYLADARTLWVYHQNPMQVPPDAHAFVLGISWSQQPSPYGPLWQLLSVVPVAFTGNHWVAGVIGFKLLSMVCYLASAALIFVTVKRTWPGRELQAALIYAWNPFVVFRVIGNGHNDAAMMALALGAIYFVARRWWMLAIPLLAMSVCIKYSTLLIVPPVLLYAWVVSNARERRDLYLATGLAIVVAALLFLPFWRGFDTFKTFIQNTNLTITAVPQIVSIKLQEGRSAADADHLVRVAGYVVFALVYLALLVTIYLRPAFRGLVAACALVFIAYLLLCTWWFRPWYFIWFLSLTALLPSFWWTALAVATSFGATFFDLVEQYRSHWSWIWSNEWRAYAAPVFSAFLPLVVVLLLGVAITGAWSMMREPPAPEGAA